MMGQVARAAALGVCLAVCGCASPDPNYYTLQPVPGTTRASAGRVIEVRRPGLAGYLDRSDIVLKTADYRLQVTSLDRWGEPLGDMIGRVLTQDLQQRLPGASVFGQDGAITADPDLRVEVDVQRFDPQPDGTVVLQAGLAIEKGAGHTSVSAHTVALTVVAPAPGAAGVAAAMSTLLGELADDVAGSVIAYHDGSDTVSR